MREIKGAYASAKIFTDNVEEYALAQVKMICDNAAAAGSVVRVMPDVHPGKIGPIGLTMTLTDAVMPGIVGIDIGCGMTLAKLKDKRMEWQKLDAVIRDKIPAGFQIRKKAHRYSEEFPFTELRCLKHINLQKAMLSMGTLGGGNHFIEVDKDEDQRLYIVIHSGSRSLGKAVAEYYLKAGQAELKERHIEAPYELTYLTGALMEDYLHDQRIAQEYAAQNRAAMLDEIVKGMKLKVEETFSCVHNYIETTPDRKVLRKGAISAQAGERVIIPINMKDGVILGVGKGNGEWNCSAPHGSGRLLKRTEVSSRYTVASFKKEMQGVYSSCINKATLDEAPFAYRRLEEIKGLLSDTVEIECILQPVYNFKAGGED
ncbi:MAG: RtcB family protein [Phascolarctobacterium sp.]|uniref:RtcB family protein n=1 Tax=Phascolarctobacterium sp. TaxID=2049039 RepID=UPI0026DD8854|nr:RtcB family protein [Phascolarctobacterium sp.]MDO4921772.1 RtcB family protein [Phascolarctobacterium sp.]